MANIGLTNGISKEHRHRMIKEQQEWIHQHRLLGGGLMGEQAYDPITQPIQTQATRIPLPCKVKKEELLLLLEN